MEQLTDSLELGVVSNKDEAALRIRGLRILARIIAGDLMNNRRGGKNNNNTTTDDLRNQLTHDEGLYRT